METAAKRICTVYVTLKESVRKSTKVLFAWDSGSAIVLVTDLLMLRQAGTQYPGYTWKKYLPHRLNNSRAKSFCFTLNDNHEQSNISGVISKQTEVNFDYQRQEFRFAQKICLKGVGFRAYIMFTIVTR